jgi:hypothetical protein
MAGGIPVHSNQKRPESLGRLAGRAVPVLNPEE